MYFKHTISREYGESDLEISFDVISYSNRDQYFVRIEIILGLCHSVMGQEDSRSIRCTLSESLP